MTIDAPPAYHSSLPYDAERFLEAPLPDYELERRGIVTKSIASVVIFIFVLPSVLATITPSETRKQKCDADHEHEQNEQHEQQRGPKKRRGVRRDKKKSQKREERCSDAAKSDSDQQEAVDVSFKTSFITTLLCVTSIFFTFFLSANNLFAARTIFVAPILTSEECARIIDMAHRAAQRKADTILREREQYLLDSPQFMGEEDAKLAKYDSILEEPSGWTKDRHTSYPTTDLNVVTDPFTAEDRAWLAEKLNARLSVLMERTFGVFRGAVRANDIFVVRYEPGGQPNLRRHTDSSFISFNIILNDGFEGGGTRFHSRPDGTHIDVKPPAVGYGILSNANILHEGLATTNGTRYILVGFDDIDERDPFTGEDTSLSVFSSWLNFSWMQIRFKEGWQDGRLRSDSSDRLAWHHSHYAVSVFNVLHKFMTATIDISAKFRIMTLVSPNNAGSYIAAMDREAEKTKHLEATRSNGFASWFAGQQIDVDVFGNLNKIWDSRKGNEDKFRAEDL